MSSSGEERDPGSVVAGMASLSLDSRVDPHHHHHHHHHSHLLHSASVAHDRNNKEEEDKGKEDSEGHLEEDEDDDYDEEEEEDDDEEEQFPVKNEEEAQGEAASRLFYKKTKGVAELLSFTNGQPVKRREDAASAGAEPAGTHPAAAADPDAADGAVPQKVEEREARLRELVRRRQELARLEARLKGLEEALGAERSELARLEAQLPSPAAADFTTLIATKSSLALLELRDQQLAAAKRDHEGKEDDDTGSGKKANKEERRRWRLRRQKREKRKSSNPLSLDTDQIQQERGTDLLSVTNAHRKGSKTPRGDSRKGN